MAVRIRLRRIGRKKQPSYRVVAAESTSPRSGAYLEALGFYNPRTSPAELKLDMERVEHWLAHGATLTTTADSLVRKARRGGDATVRLLTEAPAAAAPVAGEPMEQQVAAPVAAEENPAAPGSTADELVTAVQAPDQIEAPEAPAPEEPTEA